MRRPIAISLSPNTQNDDVLLATKTLISPRKWFDENEVEKLEKEFALIFGKDYKALSVNSARSAWYLILKALGVDKKDEVIIQAFTCVAVPNSIIWAHAKPIYVDINSSYNLDLKDLSEKVSEKTKVILIQNTFGIPGDYRSIKKIARVKNITLVEDCAHALGATYGDKLIGGMGDISFFSFGRDKVLSSVFGGMILCKDLKLYRKIKNLRDSLPDPSIFWVLQQLLHPILFALVLPFYSFGFRKITFGKFLLYIFQKLKLISFPVYEKEKRGERPEIFPRKMPGALAVLARNQIRKLGRYNEHRQKIASFYFENLKAKGVSLPPNTKGAIWLRFPVKLDKANLIFEYAKSKGLLFGNWYKGLIQPALDPTSLGYKIGSCPNAEKISNEVVNLPTYPTLSLGQASRVVNIVNEWLNSK